jgi:hypothetical protein
VPVLEWPARVKIAAGSARGIAYLHEDCNDISHSFLYLCDNLHKSYLLLLNSFPWQVIHE